MKVLRMGLTMWISVYREGIAVIKDDGDSYIDLDPGPMGAMGTSFLKNPRGRPLTVADEIV